MAYLNLLAAVDPKQVANLRDDPSFRLTPSRVEGVSHLLGNPGWITHQLLVSVLAEALDGGELLIGLLWHPLRVPKYHRPSEAGALASNLDQVWGDRDREGGGRLPPCRGSRRGCRERPATTIRSGAGEPRGCPIRVGMTPNKSLPLICAQCGSVWCLVKGRHVMSRTCRPFRASLNLYGFVTQGCALGYRSSPLQGLSKRTCAICA